jgi:hypothetical protein
MKGAFTQDTFSSICLCGKPVYLLRRGPITLIPKGHRCKFRSLQEQILKTIQLEESVGIRYTKLDVAKKLQHFGLGNVLTTNKLITEEEDKQNDNIERNH